ncbi:hypothetical protein FRB96_000868 [Tulasnella sp. 330]|nr:hypothetical protein FRB96_000868 [Tulasnella sp. 330]KAG8882720.1 hypothetical protein FRB97_007860 [Tulasnella sp. 331]KAG8888215.1 hypothetical protein FRB98_008155 [Tulasnella sp. 332]
MLPTMVMHSFDHPSTFYNSSDITPPITPLKQRIKKQLSPINVAAATAHFQDARARSQPHSPAKSPTNIRENTAWSAQDVAVDALETPPLSAASTDGEVSAPLDAVHPLFGNLAIEDEEAHDVGLRTLDWGQEQDMNFSWGDLPQQLFPALQHTPSQIGPAISLGDSPSAPPPTPQLPLKKQFTPPRKTTLYHYSTIGDSLVFFDPCPKEHAMTPPGSAGSSPTTPKAKVKRSQGRHKGNGRSTRSLTDATTRPPLRRTSPARKSIAGSRRLSTRLTTTATSSSSRAEPRMDVDNIFSAPRGEMTGHSGFIMEDADDSGEDRDGISAFQPLAPTAEGSRRILLPTLAAGARKPFGTTLG